MLRFTIPDNARIWDLLTVLLIQYTNWGKSLLRKGMFLHLSKLGSRFEKWQLLQEKSCILWTFLSVHYKGCLLVAWHIGGLLIPPIIETSQHLGNHATTSVFRMRDIFSVFWHNNCEKSVVLQLSKWPPASQWI